MLINFVDAAYYYKAEPHQIDAWSYLQDNVDSEVLLKFTEMYRQEMQDPVFKNDWASITRLAEVAGAKFPELVAAQWALESGWGLHVSGKNNYFGIKGTGGTTKKTWEDFGDGPVIIYDSFKDFSTPQDCVDDLVTKWYHDYKGYIGVNRQPNREAAAYHLKAEGYATDPAYPQKLIRLMDMNA